MRLLRGTRPDDDVRWLHRLLQVDGEEGNCIFNGSWLWHHAGLPCVKRPAPPAIPRIQTPEIALPPCGQQQPTPHCRLDGCATSRSSRRDCSWSSSEHISTSLRRLLSSTLSASLLSGPLEATYPRQMQLLVWQSSPVDTP